jgi:hypothetical protein
MERTDSAKFLFHIAGTIAMARVQPINILAARDESIPNEKHPEHHSYRWNSEVSMPRAVSGRYGFT